MGNPAPGWTALPTMKKKVYFSFSGRFLIISFWNFDQEVMNEK